jgi:hypothetical protein
MPKSRETIAVPVEPKEEKETRVRIFLPKRENDDATGVAVDQYEHVSISNEKGDNFVRIKRGEYVDVTPEVFILLKQRYPNL